MLAATDIVAFVPAQDLAKARAFYEGVLGLHFVKDDGFALMLDANGLRCGSRKCPWSKDPEGNTLSITEPGEMALDRDTTTHT